MRKLLLAVALIVVFSAPSGSVAASTQAMAFAGLHQRHASMTRKAEVDGGCPAYHHRGVSGACVLNPDYGPYKPDPYWTPCDYSSGDYAEGCGGD
jgi:hypothetical protein